MCVDLPQKVVSCKLLVLYNAMGLLYSLLWKQPILGYLLLITLLLFNAVCPRHLDIQREESN